LQSKTLASNNEVAFETATFLNFLTENYNNVIEEQVFADNLPISTLVRRPILVSS